MKVPLCYPKTPTLKKLRQTAVGFWGPAVAFRKYDGTNVHLHVDAGEPYFGTRRNRFHLGKRGQEEFQLYSGGNLKYVPQLMEEALEGLTLPSELSDTFCQTYFAEYHCPDSFDGEHPEDAELEEFRLTLFDIKLDDKDFLGPNPFQEMAQKATWGQVAEEVWRGRIDSGKFSRFVQDVKNDKRPDFEGVIIKGASTGNFKIKSELWLAKREAKLRGSP